MTIMTRQAILPGRISIRRGASLLGFALLAATLAPSCCGVVKAADDVAPAEPPVERVTNTAFSKFFLRYSPDGAHLVYSRQHANRRATNQILVGMRVVKADGTGDRPLMPEFDKEVQIQEHGVFSPDGKLLYLSGGGNDTGNSSKDVFRCEIDAQFKATGLRKVVPGAGVGLGEEPTLSPDGKRICFVSINEQLWVADADGKNKTSVVQVSGSYLHQPDWSPDGEWISFATDRDGNVEIYKVRWDGTELTRLTDEPGIDCRPRWSPDGEWILFTSNRAGNNDLFIMRADGRELRRMTTHAAPDDSGCWHPNGKSIAFVSLRGGGGFDIYRMSVPADLQVAAAPRVRPQDRRPAPKIEGLVLRYDFENVTGDQVKDLAGGNHGTLSSGAKAVVEDGRGSVELDGKEAHILCGNGAQLRVGGALTLSLWAKPAAVGGNGYLISKHGWNIYLGAGGTPNFETRSAADSAWDTLPSPVPLKTGEWTFVTAVFDPEKKTLAVYVDGKKTNERARTDGAVGSVAGYPLALGHYTASKTQKFSGRLDEVRVYNKALSAEEIAAEFTQQKKLVAP